MRGGQVHPNGRWLVYAANFDWRSGKSIEPSWIYRCDVASGRLRILARPGVASVLAPQLSPDGKYVLYIVNAAGGRGIDVRMVGIDGREDAGLVSSRSAIGGKAAWFPDSRRILVTVDEDEERCLGVVSLKTHRIRGFR